MLHRCLLWNIYIACVTSGPEDVDSADDVLSADRTLAHSLSTLCTRDHVTALQQHAVDHRVHADTTQILIRCQPSRSFTLCTHTHTPLLDYIFIKVSSENTSHSYRFVLEAQHTHTGWRAEHSAGDKFKDFCMKFSEMR